MQNTPGTPKSKLLNSADKLEIEDSDYESNEHHGTVTHLA